MEEFPPAKTHALIRSRNIKIYTAIIVMIINLCFFSLLCVGFDLGAIAVRLLFFNVVSFFFLICTIAFGVYQKHAWFIAYCILYSTIVLVGQYVITF